MLIKKINIENFKCFKDKFSLEFSSGVNILVGNNEAGKSTILEAINLALTGVRNGRYLKNELSQYLFNNDVVKKYLDHISHGEPCDLPYILIEVFFTDNSWPLFKGNGNSEKIDECGIIFKIEFDSDYKSEYEALVSTLSTEVTTIPIEYYKVTWKSCSREPVTARSIPLKSVLIDSSSNRYQNGSDMYISRIIRDDLEDKEKIELSQAFRKMKESFMDSRSIKAINDKVKNKSKISDKNLHISVDLSTYNSWETTLMTYLDEIPFHQIGKGEQCIIKTNLALSHQKSREASLILLEEPENHLSHTKLNELMKSVTENCEDKQVIISTHSSFVANKLGLENLILLSEQQTTRLSDLNIDTYDFFKKLPGYQTLRLLLCRKAVLVEGDSDELIFQRAYMDKNDGKLPIEDGIDVISVKLTFKRFLEIAVKINKKVAVITDNDSNYEVNITNKYRDYYDIDCIKIFADKRNELNTLEPQFIDANSPNLEKICEAIEIDYSNYNDFDKIRDYMIGNKTKWALNIFESETTFEYPQYIKDAVTWCNE
jgi:putative ATP-dependent endonuclease of the OLD family